jgi:hypothetical protein
MPRRWLSAPRTRIPFRALTVNVPPHRPRESDAVTSGHTMVNTLHSQILHRCIGLQRTHDYDKPWAKHQLLD